MHFLLLLVLAQSPTLGYVNKIQPGLSPERAAQVTESIEAASQRYSVEPKLLAAIVVVESNLRPGLRSCVIVHRYLRCEVTCDYGIAQINETWIETWKLDPQRLLEDERYNLMVAARILASLKKEYAAQEPHWFGRYHSGTPSKRAIYESKLLPLLVQDDGSLLALYNGQ